MPDVIEQIDAVASQGAAELAAVKSSAELEQFRIKFLGSNGLVKGLMKLLGQVPKDQKPAVGQKVNAVKDQLASAFESRKGQLAAGAEEAVGVDITEPGKRPAIGARHILYRVMDELTELFGRMGFAVAAGPEVEDEFHNFIALNIPRSHPARDPLDNFYLDERSKSLGSDEATKGRSEAGGEAGAAGQSLPSSLRGSVAPSLLLRTQTSTVQIRVMEKQKPPIRVVIPGKVFRPDTHDETHLSMFHQLEALVVDKNVTMVDLKSTITQFVHAYFGENTRTRFRPSFFPFTEPSAEVDVWFEDKQQWIELGGCGMVHPNVLKTVNIDPEVFSGWAFGFGIERIAMRKYGISDIRLFVENDIRFLRQF